MLDIQVEHIQYNFAISGTKKDYIVIHSTANTGKGANALAHYNYFNDGDRQASAQYFIDDSNIIETVNPKYDAWHAGDGHGKFGITNRNSIGLEMCMNEGNDKVKTIQNTIELTISLMKEFNIQEEKVVRHYDASHKDCPILLNEDGKWTEWFAFKAELSRMLEIGKNHVPVVPSKTPVITLPTPSTPVAVAVPVSPVVKPVIVPAVKPVTPILKKVIAVIKPVAKAQTKLGTVTADKLNVRESDSLTATVIGQLKKGDQVKIAGIVGNFYSLFYGSHGGFVSKDFIKLK